MMDIFFDTEFSDFLDPRLISIGLISEQGDRTFYAELTDAYQLSDCSDFTREAVLPRLQGGEARMTLNECAQRLVQWLRSFGEPVQLATDSLAFDWPWIEELIAEAGTGWPENVAIRPLILQQSPEFNLAVEDAFNAGLRRHHSLDDAKANRLGRLAQQKDKEVVFGRFSI